MQNKICYRSKLFFTILSFIIFILSSIEYINKPLSDSEIKAIGTGFEVIHNINSHEKFAILEPPLAGIMSYLILNTFYTIDNISYITSGNYFDMISFLFALETSKMIGKKIVLLIGDENCKIIRYLNLLWLVIIFYLISKDNIILCLILMFFLYPIRSIIITSSNEILSVLLVITTLDIMNFIIKNDCIYKQYIFLGVIVGLLISGSGFNGVILGGMAISSVIIESDLEKKKFNKGFKKKYFIGYLLLLISAIFCLWICYGMNLVSLNQLGLSQISNIKIIPYFDTIKQIIFESIFLIDDNQYSFFDNISIFFNLYNNIIIILSLLISINNVNQNSIFSIMLIISIAIYNSPNYEHIHIFFTITSILLAILTTLDTNRLFSIKK